MSEVVDIDILDSPFTAHLVGGPYDGRTFGIDTPTPTLRAPGERGLDHVYVRRVKLGGQMPREFTYRYRGLEGLTLP